MSIIYYETFRINEFDGEVCETECFMKDSCMKEIVQCTSDDRCETNLKYDRKFWYEFLFAV